MLEPGMIIEEVLIALDTGLCPRCGGPLEMIIQDLDQDDTEFHCMFCHWRGGFGGCLTDQE